MAPPTFFSCRAIARRATAHGLSAGYVQRRYRSARGASLFERGWWMVVNDKAALRAVMRSLRRSLAERQPDAAYRAASHAAGLPPCDLVALYSAMSSELDPQPLGHALIAAGLSLCLPVVLERDAPLIFRRWLPGDPLEMDIAGCPAPLPLAEIVDPDLIVTPLLAFDDHGGRLGQGGGYYDRTFAARPEVVRVGLAYAGQKVQRLPIQAHDVPLSGMLTEAGYEKTYPFDISQIGA